MQVWKKILVSMAIFTVILFTFLIWYKLTYTMAVAESFSVTVENPKNQILIATQGSEYKDSVVEEVIKKFANKPANIEVIDVTAVGNYEASDWDAIVLIHTWEQWQPQPDAEKFIKANLERNNIVVLTTSGDGSMKMEHVDAITSASVLSQTRAHADMIVQRVNKILSQ